jgi:hypothetical protein
MARDETQSGWRWTFLAAVVGAVTSATLTSALRLDRYAFVAGWTIVVLVLWVAYARRHGVKLRTQITRHLTAGLITGGTVGAMLAWTVARQPASPAPTGATLFVDLVWLGAVYGAVDAVILAILPVLALYGTRSADAVRSARGRLSAAAAALIGSALITAAYHLGFREFQGPQLVLPVLGGVLTTLTYLLSGSIAAPIVAHVVMHAAAVLHGAATTVQLPPHY